MTKFLKYSLLLLSLVLYEYTINFLILVAKLFTLNEGTVTFGIIIVLSVFSCIMERRLDKKLMEERDATKNKNLTSGCNGPV